MLTLFDASDKIALGTVQLGLDYGISNRAGRVTESEAQNIFRFAESVGIRTWDTARGYGTSEEVIGRWRSAEPARSQRVRLVTKIPKLTKTGSAEALKSEISDQLESSLKSLRADFVDTVLLHDESDLAGEHGRWVWSALERLRSDGKVRKLGVSSYSPDVLAGLIEQFPVETVQVPYNLLDRRFFTDALNDLYRRNRIEIHVRSVFLQGLFFLSEGTLPPHMGFASSTLARLTDLARLVRSTVPELAICSAIAHPLIAKAVIGVTSSNEFREILSWKCASIPGEIDQELRHLWKLTEGRILDPRRWKADS